MNKKLFKTILNSKIFFGILVSTLFFTSCNNSNKEDEKLGISIITSGLKYCEGSVAYGNDLLVSNFGCETFNPLNEEGRGYIVKIQGDTVLPFINADGYITGPKGMAITNNHLFIADVGKMVVYNLNDLSGVPQTIVFPEGNLFVNDIVVKDNIAYISVTNTGKIFKMDISNIDNLSTDSLIEYALVPGANGLVLDGSKMYIASYPADGVTSKENLIYMITNLEEPNVEVFLNREGQYDGLALYNSKLYFTSWENSEIGFVDIATKEVTLFEISAQAAQLTGPADITILNDKLYIPNLPSSEVVVVDLK